MTEFRKNIATHVDKMEDDSDQLIVTRQNRDPFVVISLREWESMNETAYLLGNPVNRKILLESIAELDAGKGTEHELIDP